MHFIHPVLTAGRAVLLVLTFGLLVTQAQEVVSPRFIPCGTGEVAVCDLQTGLMWETKTEAPAGGSGPCSAPLALHGVDLACTVEEAQTVWIPALNAEGSTGYAGYTDWRMPSIRELVTIFDYDQGAIDPAVGPVSMVSPRPVSAPGRYLSSTQAARIPGQEYWFINFTDARGRFGNTDDANFVRAVRGGPSPAETPAEERFIPCGVGEIAICDLQTGLMWETKIQGEGACLEALHALSAKCTHDQATGPWIDGLNAEGNNGYAGYADWRLPTLQELFTIMDYTELNDVHPLFGPSRTDHYWSSTLRAPPGEMDIVWTLTFGGTSSLAFIMGGAPQAVLTSSFESVRAVRGGR